MADTQNNSGSGSTFYSVKTAVQNYAQGFANYVIGGYSATNPDGTPNTGRAATVVSDVFSSTTQIAFTALNRAAEYATFSGNAVSGATGYLPRNWQVLGTVGNLVGCTINGANAWNAAAQGNSVEVAVQTCSCVGSIGGGLLGASTGNPLVIAGSGYLGGKFAEYTCKTLLDTEGLVPQALAGQTGTPINPSTPAALSGLPNLPARSNTADFAAEVVRFRPSPDYAGADGAYTVQKGQTLWGISQANGITLQQLVAANPQIADPNSLRIGQVIRLPETASGYQPGAGGSGAGNGLPDAEAQKVSLTQVLNETGGDVQIINENSGRIVVVSGDTGNAVVVSQNGAVSTQTFDSYWQEAQTRYDQLSQLGLVDTASPSLVVSNYQDGTTSVIEGTGQGTVFAQDGAMFVDGDGNLVAQVNGEGWRGFDAVKGNETTTRLDQNGNLVSETRHYDANAQLESTQVITTGAEVRTTDIYRDINGDGSVDRKETITERNGTLDLDIESEVQISGNAAVYRTVLIDAETGETLGAVRIAEAALTADSLPDAASPSSTLSFTQAMLEAERFYAGDAHEIRSFVGLETPLLAGDDTLSGDGAAATTVWLREFDTLIGPRVINDEVAELQADWTLGTDGSAAQGAAGQGTTLDAPMPLDIDGVYTIDLSWLNPTYGYNALQPPVIGLDPELDFSYTYEAPKLVVWDFTQDTGFNYTVSGSGTWELGGGLDTGLADPYSNYDLYNDYAYDLYGLGSLFTVGQGGYSSGLGGGFSLDLGGGSDFSVGDYGPVVLDLDGDGIELVAAGDSRAWYDLDGHGARFHTGWVGADDALLAIDDNGDGEISSGREIAFSLYTEADETDTDMEALATVFDSNADGRLDFNDERYADFRLWQDANGNGESDAGEVRTHRTVHRCATAKVSPRNTAGNSSAVNRSVFKPAMRAQGIPRSGVCLW